VAVVDAADQGQVRSTTLQPVVAARVDLEQHALTRTAVLATARIRCTVERESTIPWISASISMRCCRLKPA